jgi:hypothetical protein
VARKRNPKKRAYLAAFVRTCSVTGAARAAGVDPARHYEWLRADPEYRAAYQAAQDQAAQTLEDEAIRRAYEGVERPVTVAGKRELVREYSDTLLIFLLKGLRPAKYRERYDVAVEAGDSLVQAMARGKKRAAELALESDKPAQLPPVIDLVPV